MKGNNHPRYRVLTVQRPVNSTAKGMRALREPLDGRAVDQWRERESLQEGICLQRRDEQDVHSP